MPIAGGMGASLPMMPPQDTGAFTPPVADTLATEGGDDLVTEAGDQLEVE
jgi:hypothetical protein